MTEPSAGVIHDIGYQRYDGPRLGRRYIVRTLFGQSLRAAYGLGRGAKAKIFPWAVAGVVLMVAGVLTALRVTLGETPVGYADFGDELIVLVVLFAAVVAPELASRDVRAGVLPLYFARPLYPVDYAVAKLGALVGAVWLLLAGPLTVMLAGAVFSAGGPGEVGDELLGALGGYAYAALVAVVVAAPALLVASLVGRRAVAAGATVAVFLVTLPVVELLSVPDVAGDRVARLAGLGNPATLVSGVRQWLDGEPQMAGYGGWYVAATVVFVAGCVALVVARYRRIAR